MRKLAITIFLCWLAASSAVQAQQFVFRAYQQPQGLKNLAVNALATDREGFLWVATENGVYRFLGTWFAQYGRAEGIAEPDVRDIVADQSGNVWVGTDNNIYRWDGRRFSPIARQSIPVPRQGLMAVEDANHLLVVYKDRLHRLEHDATGKVISLTPVLPEWMVAADPELGEITSVSVVSDGPYGTRIWVGCGKKLFSWLDRDPSGRIPLSFDQINEWNKAKGLREDEWENVVADHGGTIWAGGLHHVAALVRGSSKFVDRSIPDTDPGSTFKHAPLIEDREGRMLAPAEAGIARWEGSKWQLIGRRNGLQRTNHVAGMALDTTGDLWVASRGDGLHLWAGYEDWEGWTDEQGLPSAVVWVTAPQRADRVFVGTEKGPAWVNPQTGASAALRPGQPWTFGQVGAMGIDSDGSLWAGTFSGGILRIDSKTGRTEEVASIPAFILSGFQDSSGRVLLSTKKGLYIRKAKTPHAVPQRVTALDPLLGPSARVDAGCAAPDGTLWFLAGNRVVRSRNDSWTLPPIDGLPKFHGSLLSISCGPDGQVWVTGDMDGTWRLTPSGGRLSAWQLPVPAEMRSLAPLAILADRRGWIWLGTDVGVVVWNGTSWRQITQESGLIWNDVNQGSLRSAPDGSLWVGTSGGVAHLMHPERVFAPIPIPVSVTAIRRGSQTYPAELRSLTLPWSAQTLSFQISSPSMRNRSDLSFVYRMEGAQSDWLDDWDGTVVFPALSPGSYTFAIVAQNPSLSAYSAPVRIAVEILPPWWRSYWFFVLCGLAVVLLFLLVQRIHGRNLRRRSVELERLVRTRTRELEASREQLSIQATHDGLTGLLNRSAVLQALENEMERARRENRSVTVALADLDHFKRVNDTYGHLAGDAALRRFAAAISAAVRGYDHAGRFGGEEFLLVVSEIPNQAAEQRLARLHASITDLAVQWHGKEFRIACSLGATIFDPRRGATTVESLLAAADLALYDAKAGGRNRVVFMTAQDLNAVPAVTPRPRTRGTET